MGSGTTLRPHLINWDYRAGYRASSRYVADTTHFLLSVSRQACERAEIAHPDPSCAQRADRNTPCPESTTIFSAPPRIAVAAVAVVRF
jgi:hypothetical protein